MALRRNPNLKRTNEEHEYTPEQLLELRKCAEEPIYFIDRYCRIQHPVKGSVPFRLYNYQKEMIHAFMENRFVVVLSARQTGKALSVQEQIPTPSGFVTMETIQPGDFVLDAEGKPTKVTAVSPIQYDRPCYKVHFSTGETIVADGDHLWEVECVENKSKKYILTTQQMSDRGVQRKNSRGYVEGKFHVKLTQPLQLEEKQLTLDPYVLGVWLGDGTTNAPSITNHTNDIEIIEAVRSTYEASSVYTGSRSLKTKTYYFKNLICDLRKIGVFGNKHIPINYLRGSYEQRLSLLQGLMDTDGYVNYKTGLCEITLTDETLSKDVHHLISTLGLKSTIKQRDINGKLPHRRWTITFTPYQEQCNPFRLSRKAQHVKNSPHPTRTTSTRKRTITKIEPTDSVPVKCIVVDNPHNLFLVGKSLIPTHNSTVSAAYLLWYASFKDDKTVLIASNKNPNAMEMIHRIQYMYENLPMWLKPGLLDDGWNKHSFSFENKSRIQSTATSETAGRGGSISLLFLDEFAFVEPNIQEEFWTSMSPTLATGGSCIMSSTPNGDTNLFSQIWRGAQVERTIDNLGGNGFFPVEIPWNAPPGRDEEFKRGEMARVGEQKWLQEYECRFISSDPLLIDPIALENIKHQIREPKVVLKDVKFWRSPRENSTYLVGVDPATGTGADFTTIVVFEFPSMEQIAEWRSNTMSSKEAYQVLKNIVTLFEKTGSEVFFSIENNGVGEGIIALYDADENQSIEAEFICESGKEARGIRSTPRSKMRACLSFKEMVEKGQITLRSKILHAEMKEFIRHGAGYEARVGSTDDLVTACLIITRILEEMATYDDAAYAKLYIHNYQNWEQAAAEAFVSDDKYDENDADMAPAGMVI